MLEIFTVSLFGHREVPYEPTMEAALEQIVRDLLQTHSYVSFLLGRDGEFDRLAASIIQQVRKEWGDHNSELVWVMPYLKQDYLRNQENYDQYYTYIEVCEESAAAHFKAAMEIRNKQMIDRSQLVIGYVRRNVGGAAKALAYAKQKNIPVLEL